MTAPASRRLQITATVLLSVAALATSWSGYEATLWSGHQVRDAGKSIVLRSKSARQSTRAGQLVAVDVGLFNSWLTERFRGDPQLAHFLEQHFRSEFKVAFNEWIKDDPFKADAAQTPFSLPSYHVSAADSALHYENAADSLSKLSAQANGLGDEYVLTAVVLATAMFFASTAQQSMRSSMRWILLALATFACGSGVIRLLTLPHG